MGGSKSRPYEGIFTVKERVPCHFDPGESRGEIIEFRVVAG
jgi:hypothetical protein